MKAWLGVIALGSAIAAAPAAASDQLSWLSGRWTGTGTSMGQPASATLEVEPALAGQFVEFDYDLTVAGSRPFRFEGRAFYRLAKDGSWQATWFDSRGYTLPIAATVAERSLTAEWGSAETERGRTVYALSGSGELEVVDSVRRPDGTLREFARLRYRKAK